MKSKTHQALIATALVILMSFGCRTNPPDPALANRPRHAGRVQVALLSSIERPAKSDLDVLSSAPTRPHKVIAILTCDGKNSEEGDMTAAIFYHARQIGADAVIRMESEIRRGAFGIPDGLVYRYTAIVYSGN